MSDSEYSELGFVESDTAEHEPVTAERFDRVYAHAAHQLLDLVIPCGEQIAEPLGSDLGIQSLHEVGTLRGDSPIASARLAGAAEVAAEREKRSRCDVYGV